MCDIKPELIEKLTEALRGVRMGDCLPEPLTPTSDEALDLAHAALEAVADDLRADGHAVVASMTYADGTPVEIVANNNPYRKARDE